MNIDRFKQRCQKQPLAIALGGNERALIDEALHYLRSTFAEVDGLNHHRFDAAKDEISHIIATLYTMPFLATTRVVELHGAEKLDAKEAALLSDYLKKPSESSLFIVIFNKLDKRNKFVSNLVSQNLLCEFGELSEQDFIVYAQSYARGLNVDLPFDAAQFLALVLERDVVALQSAVSKLALVFAHKKVSVDDIERHILAHGEQDVFIFARSLGEGRLSDALFFLGKIKNNRENALKLLGVIIWQMRVFVGIRRGLDAGLPEREICQQVSVYGERYRWMEQVARKKNFLFHVQRLTKLLDCDRALKSISLAEPLNLVEKVVYQCAVGM